MRGLNPSALFADESGMTGLLRRVLSVFDQRMAATVGCALVALALLALLRHRFTSDNRHKGPGWRPATLLIGCAVLVIAGRSAAVFNDFEDEPCMLNAMRLNVVITALQRHYHAGQRYPNALVDVLAPPYWPGDQVPPGELRDAWGNAFTYAAESGHARIESAGEDQKPKTKDDMVCEGKGEIICTPSLLTLTTDGCAWWVKKP